MISRVSPGTVSYLILCVVVLLIAGGYIVYSQTWAFAWDEDFHMLTANSLRKGVYHISISSSRRRR